MKKKYVCASNSLRQGQLDRLVRKIKDFKPLIRCADCAYWQRESPDSIGGYCTGIIGLNGNVIRSYTIDTFHCSHAKENLMKNNKIIKPYQLALKV